MQYWNHKIFRVPITILYSYCTLLFLSVRNINCKKVDINQGALRQSSLLRVFFLFIFLLVYIFKLQAQNTAPDNIHFSFEVLEGKSTVYKTGDIVVLEIIAVQSGRTCNKGLERTRILTRGLRIVKQEPWTSDGQGKWLKVCQVVILDSRNDEASITAYRKTDKGEVVGRFFLRK